MPHLINYKDRR